MYVLGSVSIFHLPPYNIYCKFLIYARITNAIMQWEFISLPSEIYPQKKKEDSTSSKMDLASRGEVLPDFIVASGSGFTEK